MSRFDKLIILGLVGAFLLALMVWIYRTYNPMQSQWFPKCPSKEFLDIDCPGCGSQRAIHQLLNGNLLLALAYNPLFIIYLPYVILGFLLRFLGERMLFAQKVYRIAYGYWATKISLILVILFSIVRNMSWWQNLIMPH